MPDGRCVLVCRVCGGDPIPFSSYRERGRWATQHTSGTGHADWFCADGWPTPEEVAAIMPAVSPEQILRERLATAKAHTSPGCDDVGHDLPHGPDETKSR